MSRHYNQMLMFATCRTGVSCDRPADRRLCNTSGNVLRSRSRGGGATRLMGATCSLCSDRECNQSPTDRSLCSPVRSWTCCVNPQQHRPTKLAAHLYLLVGIGVPHRYEPTSGEYTAPLAIGIAVELGLVSLMLIFAQLEHLSVGEVLRLRPPEPRTIWLALAAVPGLWIAGVTLNLLSALVLGYTTSVSPAQYRQTVGRRHC